MRNDRPDRLIAALGTELELTAEDIADILWLTHIQQQQVEKSPSTFKVYFGDIPVNNLGFLIFLLELNFLVSILFCYQFLLSNLAVNKILMKTKSKIEPAPKNNITSQTTTKTTKPPQQIGIVTRKKKQKNINSLEEAIDKPIKVPNAPSIRQPLPLIKALRPLLRSVPSQINPTLDEIATANKIAEERIWQVITQPTLEPWLELALVVDESSSMLIWHRTVWELKKLFNHYGAFRDVRTWSLVVDKAQLGILPKMGMVAKRTMIRSPSELIDPNNRRLILIASDCLSSIWQEQTILPALENWANNAPVAIVQMFPERMWSRTSLGQVSEVELYGLAPGVINKDLLVTRSFLWNDENEKQEQVTVKIPVFSLEPEVASVWSSMVSGKGSISSAGFLFTSELVSAQELVSLVVLLLAKAEFTKFVLLLVSPSPSANSSSLLGKFTPKELVNQFLASATPLARRLTTLLAASPIISLPVVRLIQETMLPQSQQVHVAEVLCGGLFVPKSSPNINTHPDELEYRFLDEKIRSVLLESAPVTDTVRILSKYIYRKFGRSLDDFIAEWRIWSESENSVLAEKFRPFAVVTAEVLRRKGRQYLDFVREVETHYGLASGTSSQTSQPKISLFPEDTGETLREKIVANYAPKELLPFSQARDLAFAIDILGNTLSCIYTGYSIQREPEINISRDAIGKRINDERPYPQSKGAKAFRADIHNIFPCKMEVNGARSDLPFAEIPGDEVIAWFRKEERITSPPREQIGEYSKLASDGFEPRDAAKGKVARAMFYVYTFYQEQVDRDYFEQQKQILRKWHQEHPPTEAEIERSRKVANSAQGNHNPFTIDPTLVERIFFTLKTCTFDVANIEIQETRDFEFYVATLERKSQFLGFGNRWVINRQKQQGTAIIEVLEPGVELELIEIPGGSFMMGAPKEELDSYDSEKPQHKVNVPNFLMGRYPITQAQWRVVASWEQVERKLDPDPSSFKEDYEEIDRWTRPVEQVSWEEAVEFCDRLSQKTGRKYRLPTEAEWEYACRAGTETPFHFGETISTELANYNGNYTYGEGVEGEYRGQTTPVGYFKGANNFGLWDMHGNVWEWCEDDWHDNYENAPTDGSAWLSEVSNMKVRRGGSWLNFPDLCRSAFRGYYSRVVRLYYIGFRVVRVAPRTT